MIPNIIIKKILRVRIATTRSGYPQKTKIDGDTWLFTTRDDSGP